MDAYLDIETTGLSPEQAQITVIGIHTVSGEGQKLIQLVGEDITADALTEALVGVGRVYTYNGKRFDLPFINACLGVDIESMFPHCDLMYQCWRCKLYGGLKNVERILGIPRKLANIGGLDAVRLWWRYVNDYDEQALHTLLAYNREDVVNLKILKGMLENRTDIKPSETGLNIPRYKYLPGDAMR